uniref:Uncharacterized protein n=1 Tax=Arundo donax TaxID=35708 RepID=A0A0A8YV33_ARUDO
MLYMFYAPVLADAHKCLFISSKSFNLVVSKWLTLNNAKISSIFLDSRPVSLF